MVDRQSKFPSNSREPGKRAVPKGQHVIPRMHLQYFAGAQPTGQVWTFNKNTGVAWSAVPEETAKQTHFYSVEKADGTYDTRLEEFLSKCESKAAPIYERLISGDIPKPGSQEKADFACFAALMYTRTAAVRRDAGEMIGRFAQIQRYQYGAHESAFAGLVRRIERHQGGSISAADKGQLRNSLLDPSNFKVEVPKERTFVALSAADTLAPILFEMNWSVIFASRGFFITSDNPLVRWVHPASQHPVLGDYGFENKTAEVTMPLTPKCLLMMTWRTGLPALGGIEREAVISQNDMRAFFADEFLYAHIDHKSIRRLARQHKGSRPRLRTQGFGPKQFGKVTVPR